MIWLMLIGCGTEPDETLPEPVTATQCDEDNGLVLIESGFADEPGTSFAWTIDPLWTDRGGEFESEDAPEIVAQCPECEFQGVNQYSATVTVTDDDGTTQWAYVIVEQLCGVK